MTTVIRRWAIILGISAIVLYGAFWAYTHPNNPLTLWFAIGVIVLLALTRIKSWGDWFGNLSNRGKRLSTKSLDTSRTQNSPVMTLTIDQIEDKVSNSDGKRNKTTVFEKILNWFSSLLISDSVYLELRTLFREKLLPLSFQEDQKSMVYDVTFVRGQSKLFLGIYPQEQRYYFYTYNPEFQIFHDRSEGDQFKAEVIDKFEDWLAEQ